MPADRTETAPPALPAAPVHVASLTLSKLADGLIDPKLVLPWLLGATGAPGAAIGALVPLREAGALLPQLWLAPMVAGAPRRAPVWAAGSALQGLAALAIAAAALWVGGAAGGWLALVALAGLALARAVCSVSHKDALARTVERGARGRVSGLAGSLGAALVLGFAAALSVGIVPLAPAAIAAAVAVAGGCWLAAAALFLLLPERAERGRAEPAPGLSEMRRALAGDAELRRYLATRGLLVSVALAPPFLVMQSGAQASLSGALGQLGPLMIASALAAIAASWVWGRLADLSSRRTLMAAGALGAAVLGAAALAGALTGGLGGTAGAAAAVFAVQIAYAGARQGRKLHLTDMTDDTTRAAYTALTNTATGAILLGAGLFGLLADAAGPWAVLAVFALASAGAVAAAARLREVQPAA